jgi:hypothetical protein
MQPAKPHAIEAQQVQDQRQLQNASFQVLAPLMSVGAYWFVGADALAKLAEPPRRWRRCTAEESRKRWGFPTQFPTKRSLVEKRRLAANLFRGEPSACRGDWIRTSDLLNPILGVKAAPSRRMSQMQAF